MSIRIFNKNAKNSALLAKGVFGLLMLLFLASRFADLPEAVLGAIVIQAADRPDQIFST